MQTVSSPEGNSHYQRVSIDFGDFPATFDDAKESSVAMTPPLAFALSRSMGREANPWPVKNDCFEPSGHQEYPGGARWFVQLFKELSINWGSPK